jgi:hypothetical protein
MTKKENAAREQALAELTEAQANGDIEVAHATADRVLCDLLESLGFADVVEAYNKVDKWYA